MKKFIFSFKYISSTPWYVRNDTDDRNAKARKAYSALLIVTPKMPNNEKYKNFSVEVSITLPIYIIKYSQYS